MTLIRRTFNTSFQTTAVIDALMVGLVEEGTKYLMLRKFSWKNRNFNYRFDGIVYAVFVSLGFAALENVIYVFSYGLDIAFTRAILTIPAHMGFSVYMGYFYGRAKIAEQTRNRNGCRNNLWAGYLIAVLMHTIYDGTIMMDTDFSYILFISFVIVMNICVLVMVRSESRNDVAIPAEPLYDQPYDIPVYLDREDNPYGND